MMDILLDTTIYFTSICVHHSLGKRNGAAAYLRTWGKRRSRILLRWLRADRHVVNYYVS